MQVRRPKKGLEFEKQKRPDKIPFRRPKKR